MVYRHGYCTNLISTLWFLCIPVLSPHITQLNPPRPFFPSVRPQLLLLLSPSSPLLITLHSIVSISVCFVITPLHHIVFIFFKSGSSSSFKTSQKHLSCPLGSICNYGNTFCPVWSLCPPRASLRWARAAMLEHMSRRSRSLLSLTLTTLALALSILALCTSYWCEGTHKVVKPLCLSPVKMKNCGQNNSEPYTTGARHTVVPVLFSARALHETTGNDKVVIYWNQSKMCYFHQFSVELMNRLEYEL